MSCFLFVFSATSIYHQQCHIKVRLSLGYFRSLPSAVISRLKWQAFSHMPENRGGVQLYNYTQFGLQWNEYNLITIEFNEFHIKRTAETGFNKNWEGVEAGGGVLVVTKSDLYDKACFGFKPSRWNHILLHDKVTC